MATLPAIPITTIQPDLDAFISELMKGNDTTSFITEEIVLFALNLLMYISLVVTSVPKLRLNS